MSSVTSVTARFLSPDWKAARMAATSLAKPSAANRGS